MQIVFIGLVLIVYGLLNFYIGFKGYKSINPNIPIIKILYWVIVFFFAAAYIIAMAGRNHLPDRINFVLNTIGGYWIAAFVYLLGFVILIDIFGFLGRKLNMIPDFVKNNTWILAFSVVAVVAITLAVGTYNAMVPRIVKYDISIDKKAGDLKKLKCAMISDIHLGEIIGRDRLKTAVGLINEMEPDVVVITGDLIDNAIEPVIKQNMLEELKNINSRYGTFVVMGNHDYFSNAVDDLTRRLEDTGVTVLRDRTVKVNNSFYIVGREDKTSLRYGFSRKNLQELLEEADTTLPIIVLDHQPSELDEPRKAGVDLQLSGHTHAGQFFPASLVTNMIFEEDHGYFRDGSFNLLVSCGFGTWGPTVRIGSQSEIVELNISFAQ